MIEVEIKLPIFRRSLTERGLRSCGFLPGNLVRESDIYFTSDFHDFLQRDEALRIRESQNLTTQTCISTLTFKGAKLDQISMTRKELETEIENPKIGREILLSLGYKPLAPVVKLRQYYQKGHMTACVDQVENLGSFLELEVLVPTPGEREGALQQIASILESLGCSMDETTQFSYLWMLQKKAGLC